MLQGQARRLLNLGVRGQAPERLDRRAHACSPRLVLLLALELRSQVREALAPGLLDVRVVLVLRHRGDDRLDARGGGGAEAALGLSHDELGGDLRVRQTSGEEDAAVGNGEARHRLEAVWESCCRAAVCTSCFPTEAGRERRGGARRLQQRAWARRGRARRACRRSSLAARRARASPSPQQGPARDQRSGSSAGARNARGVRQGGQSDGCC